MHKYYKDNSLSRFPIAILMVVILGCAVISASFLPIYPDEIAYKIFLERFFINGGYKQSVTPYCISGFMVSPPLVLIPAAATWAGLLWLDSGWASYRLLPLMALLLIPCMLSINSHFSEKKSSWQSIMLITIGPVIYGLLILRPEIFIILGGLTIFVLSKFLLKNGPVSARLSISIVVLYIYSVLVYMHPKALYLTPLLLFGFLFSAFLLREKWMCISYIIGSFIMVGWLAWASLNLHNIQFISCPEVPAIQSLMGKQAVNILAVLNDWSQFWGGVSQAFGADIFHKTISQLSFKSNFDIGYLPGLQSVGVIDVFANIVNISLIFLSLIAVLSAPYLLREKISIYENILGLALMAGYFAPFFLNLTRHWYEISFFIGGLMVLLGIYYPNFPDLTRCSGIRSTKSWQFWSWLLIGASILNLLLEYKYFFKNFINRYEGPGISVFADRSDVDRKVASLLKENSVNFNESLIIDDLTYDAVKYRKILIPYTYLAVNGVNPSDARLALQKFNVQIGLVRCSNLGASNIGIRWNVIDESDRINGSKEKICLISVAS